MSPASQICLVVELPASFDRVTCLPPKNASAPWGGVGSRQLTIIVWQVSYVQYLLACQKSQWSTPYNIVKSGLPWKRVFRRRHLGGILGGGWLQSPASDGPPWVCNIPTALPANTKRNKHATIASKRRFDVIIPCLLRFAFAGLSLSTIVGRGKAIASYYLVNEMFL